MNRWIVLFAVTAALSACSKKEEAPAAATAQVTPMPSQSSTPASSLPPECEAYLKRVEACARSQSGAAADAMKGTLDRTRSAYAGMGTTDKAAMGAACKSASDAFESQAAMMKC